MQSVVSISRTKFRLQISDSLLRGEKEKVQIECGNLMASILTCRAETSLTSYFQGSCQSWLVPNHTSSDWVTVSYPIPVGPLVWLADLSLLPLSAHRLRLLQLQNQEIVSLRNSMPFLHVVEMQTWKDVDAIQDAFVFNLEYYVDKLCIWNHQFLIRCTERKGYEPS